DQLDAEPPAEAWPQVVRRRLVVIHPHHLKVRLMVDAVLLKPKNHPPYDVIGMRAKPKNRIDRRHAELSPRLSLLSGSRRWALGSRRWARVSRPRPLSRESGNSGDSELSAGNSRNGGITRAFHLVGSQ